MLLSLLACWSIPDAKDDDTGADTGVDTAAGDTDADTDDTDDTDADTDDTDADTDTGPGDTGPVDGPFGGERTTDDADVSLTGTGYDEVGRTFAAGDVDGDGAEDLVLGAIGAASMAGGAWVVRGAVREDATLADAGVSLYGSASSTMYAGRSVGAGDLDGDGRAEVLVSSPYVDECVYVMDGPYTSSRPLGDGYARVLGTGNSLFGHGVDAGDVTGDGLADLVVGAYSDDTGGAINGGAVFVVPGPVPAADVGVATVAVASAWGASSETAFGRFVRTGGDVDGDGLLDVLVAESWGRGADARSGLVHLLHGGWTGEVAAADTDARLLGEREGDQAGEELAFGDVDGDGRDEVIVGATGAATGDREGAVYVVAAPSGAVRLAEAAAIVRGDARTTRFGSGLAAGDLDGDGRDDVLMGATGSGAGGAAVLFYGPLAGERAEADAHARFTGAARGLGAGEGVAIFDLDRDGARDVLVGAYLDAGNAGVVHAFAGE